MKIALSSTGKTSEDMVDQRFGRAPYFIIFDSQTNTFAAVDNTQNLNAAQGAGIQSAQNVVQAGAEILITGHTGPKAFRVLESAKIPIYLAPSLTIKEAVEKFKNGELKKIDNADVEGHWV